VKLIYPKRRRVEPYKAVSVGYFQWRDLLVSRNVSNLRIDQTIKPTLELALQRIFIPMTDKSCMRLSPRGRAKDKS